jgi:hypothetical protein
MNSFIPVLHGHDVHASIRYLRSSVLDWISWLGYIGAPEHRFRFNALPADILSGAVRRCFLF